MRSDICVTKHALLYGVKHVERIFPYGAMLEVPTMTCHSGLESSAGNVHYALQDLDESLEHHVGSLDLRKQLDAENAAGKTTASTSGTTASSHHQIGNIYASRKLWNKALKHYKLASQ